jgi:exodeoxyribonuclease VII large subunit
MVARVIRADDEVRHLGARVRSLSPQSTLERGYAVVQHRDGRVVMSREEIERDELLRVRVARGDFGVRPVNGTEDGTGTAPG